MKKRNLAAVFGLSIITLGIYDLYWLVKTKKELNDKTRIHTPSIWLLFLPVILFIVAFIVLIVSAINSGGTTTVSNQPYQFGAPPTTSTAAAGPSIIGLLVTFVAFIIVVPVTFFWLFRFSKAINEYTNGKMNTGVTFLMLWLVHFIGVLFIQDTFNDMIDGGTAPTAPAPAMAGSTPPPAYAAPEPSVNSTYVSPTPSQPVSLGPTQPQPQPGQTTFAQSPLHRTDLPPAPSGNPEVIQPSQPDNNQGPLIQ